MSVELSGGDAGERAFASWLSLAPDAIFVCDARGRVQAYNEAACRLTGRRPARGEILSEALRCRAEDGSPLDDWAPLVSQDDDADIPRFILIERPDGESRIVRARARPLQAREGGAAGAVHVLTDVTEQRRANLLAREAMREAEAARAAATSFLANMSHEVRTPLNAVIGVAGALARTHLTPAQRDMVSMIAASGEMVERLLADVLDLSRAEAGRLNLEIASFDLRDAVNSIADLMRVRADDKGLSMTVSMESTARGMFEGDAVRIKQVLSNLLSNAIKFTETGSVSLRVSVEEAEGADGQTWLSFIVEDTGIGVEADKLERIFDRFVQADSTITRRFGGAGLGLSITKGIVDLMEGEIRVRSSPGLGSTFSVRLPLPRTMPLRDYDAHRHGLASHVERLDRKLKLRILAAEDNLSNQMVLRYILEQAGVELTLVQNGRQALEAWEADTYDLVLMDMQMPVMDGLSAIREIRRRELERGLERTPIAIVSANAMAEHKDHSAVAGADVHITKPVTPEALLSGISIALEMAAVARPAA